MFELKIMVEDKKLPEVLWSLDGKIAGPPQILPVRGAVVKKTKALNGVSKVVAAPAAKGGTVAQRVAKLMLEDQVSLGVHTVSSKDIQAFTVKAGSTPLTYNLVIQGLLKEGAIKRREKGTYVVNHHNLQRMVPASSEEVDHPTA